MKSVNDAAIELTGTPLVRVLERECEAIVDGREFDDWLLCLLIPGLNLVRVIIVTGDTGVRRRCCSSRRIVFDEPIVMIAIRVPDDVVQDNESFKLMLKLTSSFFGKGIVFHEMQHDRGILISFDKSLKGTHFRRQSNPVEAPADAGKVIGDILLRSRLCPINRRVVQGRAGEFNDLFCIKESS